MPGKTHTPSTAQTGVINVAGPSLERDETGVLGSHDSGLGRDETGVPG